MTCVCVWLRAGWEVLGLGLTNLVGIGGVLDMCLSLGCGEVGGGQGLEGWVVLCLCE